MPPSFPFFFFVVPKIRDEARVGGSAFDAIITDPPYGIREKNKAEYCIDLPLIQLVKAIALDRQDGHRLLKKGGRLVAFVPNKVGEELSDGLPNQLRNGSGTRS